MHAKLNLAWSGYGPCRAQSVHQEEPNQPECLILQQASSPTQMTAAIVSVSLVKVNWASPGLRPTLALSAKAQVLAVLHSRVQPVSKGSRIGDGTSVIGEARVAMGPSGAGGRTISQEAFEEMVKENMEDLGMEPEEALEDALQTLTLQGVDLSGQFSSPSFPRSLSFQNGFDAVQSDLASDSLILHGNRMSSYVAPSNRVMICVMLVDYIVSASKCGVLCSHVDRFFF